MSQTKKEMLGSTNASKPPSQEGKLIITFSTGQSLHFPLAAQLSTPFLTASSPRVYFGVCHATKFTEGIILLSNPTDVTARWSVEHIPGANNGPRVTAIRVTGFEDKGPEVDDPSVFSLSATSGSLEGPTQSVAAAVAAPPKDTIRR